MVVIASHEAAWRSRVFLDCFTSFAMTGYANVSLKKRAPLKLAHIAGHIKTTWVLPEEGRVWD